MEIEEQRLENKLEALELEFGYLKNSTQILEEEINKYLAEEEISNHAFLIEKDLNCLK